MPRAQFPCGVCGVKSYGRFCRQHCQVPTLSQSGIALQRTLPATTSWWCGLNGEFYDVARHELDRINRGSGVNYKAMQTFWD